MRCVRIFLLLLPFILYKPFNLSAQKHEIYGLVQGYPADDGGGFYGEGGLFELKSGSFRKYDFRSEFANPVYKAYEINGKMYGFSYGKNTTVSDRLTYLVEAESPTSQLLTSHITGFQKVEGFRPDLAHSGDTLVFRTYYGLAYMTLRDRQPIVFDSTIQSNCAVFHNGKLYYDDYTKLFEYDFATKSKRTIADVGNVPFCQLITDGENLVYCTYWQQRTNIIRVNIKTGIPDTLTKPHQKISRINQSITRIGDWFYFTGGKNLGKFDIKSGEVKIYPIDSTIYVGSFFGTLNYKNKLYLTATRKDNYRMFDLLVFDPILENYRVITSDSSIQNDANYLFEFNHELYIVHTFTSGEEKGYCVKIDVDSGDKFKYEPYRNFFHAFTHDKPQYWKGKFIGRSYNTLMSFDIETQKFSELHTFYDHGGSQVYKHHNFVIRGDILYGVENTPDLGYYVYSFDLNSNRYSYLSPFVMGGKDEDQMLNHGQYLFAVSNNTENYCIARFDLTNFDTISAPIITSFNYKQPAVPLTSIGNKIYVSLSNIVFEEPTELYEMDAESMEVKKLSGFDQFATRTMQTNFAASGDKLYSLASSDSLNPSDYLFSYSPETNKFEILHYLPPLYRSRYNTTITIVDSVIYGCTATNYSANINHVEFDPYVFSYDIATGEFHTYSLEELGGLKNQPEYLMIGPKYTKPIPESEFLIYPNPANSLFTIDFGKDFTGKVEVFNMIGQRISIQTVDEKVRTLKQDFTDLSAGNYLIRATDQNGNRAGTGHFINY